MEFPAGAKAHLYFAAFTARLKSCPDAFVLLPRRFSASCKAHSFIWQGLWVGDLASRHSGARTGHPASIGTAKAVPFQNAGPGCHRPRRILAARTVLAISMAMVSKPTPPGTGV